MTEDKTKPAAAAAELTSSEQLTEEFVREKWQELVKSYEHKQRLSSTMSSAQLCLDEVEGGKVLTFKVFNTAQKSWIETNCLHDMEGRFQSLTASTIGLKVDVIEDTAASAPAAYMPSEKAKDLIDKNEEVRNLVKDFGLEVK